jgi:hypothetical protein
MSSDEQKPYLDKFGKLTEIYRQEMAEFNEKGYYTIDG